MIPTIALKDFFKGHDFFKKRQFYNQTFGPLSKKKKKEDEVEEKKNMKMKILNKELKVEKTMNKNEEYRINWRTMNKVKKEVQAT